MTHQTKTQQTQSDSNQQQVQLPEDGDGLSPKELKKEQEEVLAISIASTTSFNSIGQRSASTSPGFNISPSSCFSSASTVSDFTIVVSEQVNLDLYDGVSDLFLTYEQQVEHFVRNFAGYAQTLQKNYSEAVIDAAFLVFCSVGLGCNLSYDIISSCSNSCVGLISYAWFYNERSKNTIEQRIKGHFNDEKKLNFIFNDLLLWFKEIEANYLVESALSESSYDFPAAQNVAKQIKALNLEELTERYKGINREILAESLFLMRKFFLIDKYTAPSLIPIMVQVRDQSPRFENELKNEVWTQLVVMRDDAFEDVVKPKSVEDMVLLVHDVLLQVKQNIIEKGLSHHSIGLHNSERGKLEPVLKAHKAMLHNRGMQYYLRNSSHKKSAPVVKQAQTLAPQQQLEQIQQLIAKALWAITSYPTGLWRLIHPFVWLFGGVKNLFTDCQRDWPKIDSKISRFESFNSTVSIEYESTTANVKPLDLFKNMKNIATVDDISLYENSEESAIASTKDRVDRIKGLNQCAIQILKKHHEQTRWCRFFQSRKVRDLEKLQQAIEKISPSQAA